MRQPTAQRSADQSRTPRPSPLVDTQHSTNRRIPSPLPLWIPNIHSIHPSIKQLIHPSIHPSITPGLPRPGPRRLGPGRGRRRPRGLGPPGHRLPVSMQQFLIPQTLYIYIYACDERWVSYHTHCIYICVCVCMHVRSRPISFSYHNLILTPLSRSRLLFLSPSLHSATAARSLFLRAAELACLVVAALLIFQRRLR